MVGYQVPAYRMLPYRPPVPQRRGLTAPQLAAAQRLGAISSMDAGDWLMLLGGAIVGGAGINGIVGNLRGGPINAISVALNLVLTAVGGTLFLQKFGKLTGGY